MFDEPEEGVEGDFDVLIRSGCDSPVAIGLAKSLLREAEMAPRHLARDRRAECKSAPAQFGLLSALDAWRLQFASAHDRRPLLARECGWPQNRSSGRRAGRSPLTCQNNQTDFDVGIPGATRLELRLPGLQ